MIQDNFVAAVWTRVSEHDANGGLDQGRPDLSLAKRIHTTCCRREEYSKPKPSQQ